MPARRPPPPIEELDGSAARAAAPDGADYITKRSADGHPFHYSKNFAHLVPEGGQWERMAALVRQDAAERAAAIAPKHRQKRKPAEHSARPSTLAAAAAFAAYTAEADAPLDEHMNALPFAELVAKFARRHKLEGADDLKPGGVMRDMAARVLAAIRKARGRG